MANKFIPKTSKPGASKFPTSGPHNPNVGTHSSGIAPKPKQTKPDVPASMPAQAGLARVSGASSSGSGSAGSAGSFMPVQRPQAGLANQRVGQQNPQTGAAATAKPKRRGVGAAFYGEY